MNQLYINLTPHDISVVDETGKIVKTIPVFKDTNGKPFCVRLIEEPCKPLSLPDIDLPVTTVPTYTGVEGLPKDDSSKPKAIIVSSLVGEYFRNKQRLNPFHQDTEINADQVYILSPNTGPSSVVRGDKGQIIGIKTFSYWCSI